MKKQFLFLLISGSFFFSYSQSSIWELIKDESGVEVYTRSVNESSIKEYKAVTIVKTTLKSLLYKITDGKHLKDRNYKTIKSSLLERKLDNEYLV